MIKGVLMKKQLYCILFVFNVIYLFSASQEIEKDPDYIIAHSFYQNCISALNMFIQLKQPESLALLKTDLTKLKNYIKGNKIIENFLKNQNINFTQLKISIHQQFIKKYPWSLCKLLQSYLTIENINNKVTRSDFIILLYILRHQKDFNPQFIPYVENLINHLSDKKTIVTKESLENSKNVVLRLCYSLFSPQEASTISVLLEKGLKEYTPPSISSKQQLTESEIHSIAEQMMVAEKEKMGQQMSPSQQQTFIPVSQTKTSKVEPQQKEDISAPKQSDLLSTIGNWWNGVKNSMYSIYSSFVSLFTPSEEQPWKW